VFDRLLGRLIEECESFGLATTMVISSGLALDVQGAAFRERLSRSRFCHLRAGPDHRGRIGILPIISSALNPARSSSPSLRLGGCPKELATDAEKVRADLTEVTEKVAREC
jgi:hypothetical protein